MMWGEFLATSSVNPYVKKSKKNGGGGGGGGGAGGGLLLGTSK